MSKKWKNILQKKKKWVKKGTIDWVLCVSLCSDFGEHSVNTQTKSKDWQDSGNFTLVKLKNSNKSFISQKLI